MSGPTKCSCPPSELPSSDRLLFTTQSFIRRSVGQLTDDYEVQEQIGAGGFGDVYICHHTPSNTERAVKVVEKSPYESENEAVLNEFNIIKTLDHPNIVKMYEFFEDDDCFYIVTDVYKGGELFEHVLEEGTFSEEKASYVMLNLLSCLNYCHKNNIVHRDIKPENILLDDNMAISDLKVIDFGLSRVCVKKQVSDDQIVGSPSYMAPEILQNLYGPPADIWACGIVCFVLLGGYTPYEGEDDEEILEQVEVGEVAFEYDVWDGVSDKAKGFIQYLLNPDPEQRPTAEQALRHPWLQARRQESTKNFRLEHAQQARESLVSIKRFSARSKLKQAVCAFIGSQLLPKAVKDNIDDVFREVDVSCDGRLDAEEMKRAFREYEGTELTDEELEDLVKRVDVDETGTIEYSEFLVASVLQKEMIDDARMKAAFDVFDSDGSGSISFAELREMLVAENHVDDYAMRQIIAEVDVNGDGEICYQEFTGMMKSGEVRSLMDLDDCCNTIDEIECEEDSKMNGCSLRNDFKRNSDTNTSHSCDPTEVDSDCDTINESSTHIL